MKLITKKAKLVLEDGSVFSGFSFGKEVSISGEVVFNTSMVGYPESLTDPSYKGQILVLTYPIVGNYGVPKHDIDKFEIDKNFESEKIQVNGLIISDYSHEYNHWKSEKTLGSWLKDEGIPGIYGIDTRALTKKIREKGVMLGKIVVDKDCELVDPNKDNLVAIVSIKEKKVYNSGKDVKILMIDCGVKNQIIWNFVKRGVTVIRVPWDYDFSNENYDGLFISNGPGDPKMCKATIENIKKVIIEKKPIWGICLGNQLLALASGADTYKLKYGHRGQNQPCIDLTTGRCYITSQNHGYAVNEEKLSNDWEPYFRNANDGTNEGIRHKKLPFSSCQFHPEATPGPKDTEYMFDKFIETIKEYKGKK